MAPACLHACVLWHFLQLLCMVHGSFLLGQLNLHVRHLLCGISQLAPDICQLFLQVLQLGPATKTSAVVNCPEEGMQNLA